MPGCDTPDYFRKTLRDEVEQWASVIRTAKIEAQ
jgi:hypothetical protein